MSWDDEVVALQADIDRLRRQFEGHTASALEVPGAVEFVLSEEFCAKPTLFPRQASLLKMFFLETELMTSFDRGVIAEWAEGFVPGDYDELFEGRWFEPAPDREYTQGTSPDVFERIELMRSRDRRWFKHLNVVAGRRAGKGELTAMAVSYIVWQLLALDEPQRHVHAARGKVLTVDVFAGNAQQARENSFADIVRIITSAPCFAPFVQSVTRDRLVLATPFDLRKPDRVRPGTIEIIARETTVLAGRGQTSMVQIFDEMAWVDPASSRAPADALYAAASPALDQARGWAAVFTISSPSQRAGKFYELHQQATEIDLGTGDAAYPEMLPVQFASWALYIDAEDATSIPLAPSDTSRRWFHVDGGVRAFPPNDGAPVIDNDELRQRERADPRAFRVENGGQWADVDDPFLDPTWVRRIFEPPDGGRYEAATRADPKHTYLLHIDPSTRHDATAYAIGHLEHINGENCCVIDLIRRWVPQGADLDWQAIYDQIEADIVAFKPASVTVDQHGGTFIVTELNQRVARQHFHERIDIHDEPHTRSSNLLMSDVFRDAVKRGRVHSYPHRQLELELRFLQDVNGAAKAPTSGPVQTDDVAIAVMMVVVKVLDGGAAIHAQFADAPTQGLPLPNANEQAVLDQFSGLHARRNTGWTNPARPRHHR